jgi:hypothetical protein
MTIKIIPIERKQSIQISILEKLVVCLGLIVTRSASLSNRKGSDNHLLCYSTRKAST